jgi:hypothetical protein
MEISGVCYQCGVRRPTKGMIRVIELKENGEYMLFCNWKCLRDYAIEVEMP